MRRLVLAIALLAGCGDDGGGPIPIDGLQNAIANAYCSLYVECGVLEDLATCRALYSDAAIDPDLLAAVEAGKVIYHPDKARECINGLTSSCNRDLFLRGGRSEACTATFEGTVPAGGQCALSEECTSLKCDVPACPDACCQGTCVGDAPEVRPHVGESCATTTDCLDSFCEPTTMVCTAYHQPGESCTAQRQCAPGNGCVNSLCTALPAEGEPCTRSDTGMQCRDIGTTCSTTTATCVAYGLTGDPCTSSLDCSPLYTCGTNATCELKPMRGEACDPQRDCIGDSYCEPATMTCTAPKPDNSPCQGDQECASNNCDSATSTCTTVPICI